MIEIKLLIKKYFKHFLVLAGLCLAIWAYIYFVHGYTKYTYHDNGQIQTKIPYVNDKRHGVEKKYYENGKLKWKKPYKEGRRYGYGGYYDDKGKPAMPFYPSSFTLIFDEIFKPSFMYSYIWGEDF